MAAIELSMNPQQQHVPAQPELGPSSSEWDAAVSSHTDVKQRVMTYLRAFGLSDEAHLKRFTELLLYTAAGRTNEPAELQSSHGVAAAMQSAERWVDELIAPFPPAQPEPGARGLALWHLRGLLQRCPDVFLKEGNWPADLRRELERAIRPVLPGPAPARMATQELGDLPPVFRSTFWMRLGGRIDALWQRLRTLFNRKEHP